MKKRVFFGALMMLFAATGFAGTNYTSLCVHNDSNACEVAVDYNYTGPGDSYSTVHVKSTEDTKTIPLNGYPNMWIVKAHCQANDNDVLTGIAFAGETIYCSGGTVGSVHCYFHSTWDCGSNT